jgi:hypothetical protein
MKVRLSISTVVLFISAAAWAQAPHATVVRQAVLYLSPDTTSAKMADVERGRDLVLLESTPDWVHVEAVLAGTGRTDDDQPEARIVSGWIPDKGVVRASTPEGDRIVFGEAVDSEDQASRQAGRRGAAADARRLYYRVYDLFPNSPLAGESLYRAADIQWQLDKADIMTKPSAKERDPFLRGEINEHWMKEVIKKFPGTKWADLASFHLIDNKLCGDWQGASKCPEKEAGIYEKYADEHPQSPATPEALYDAAWRWSALIQIYKTEEDAKKSDQAKEKAASLAQKVATQYPQSDWGARAQSLLFLVRQDVPTWGDAQE